MSSVADRASGAQHPGRDTRHYALYATLAVAVILFWICADVFFYRGEGESLAGALGGLFTGNLTFGPIFTIIFVGGLAFRMFLWETSEGQRSYAGSLLRDQTFRGIFFEFIMFTGLGVFIWWILGNTIQNLIQQNIASGFGFLNTTASFGIIQTLIQYSEESSYGRAIVVGLLNTLFVAFIGIILATILGFLVGIMRLSKNWLISKISYAYVEVMRNIPLLLQIIVWYGVLLQAVPQHREGFINIGIGGINKAGVFIPAIRSEPIIWMTVAAFIVAIVACIVLAKWAKKRLFETGQPFPVFWTSIGMLIGLPLVVFLGTGMPATIEFPNFVSEGPMLRRGFERGVGTVLIPEFVALLLALVTYTAAFIGEIVRAGIQAVNWGQTEAASALGLRRGSVLRLVVIPQALRVIIPPLTSQYLNLTKNSSLAVAIAYPDLVAVGGIVLNQAGQAIEIIGLWMLIYLGISLLTSLFMNWYNAKMALVER